MSKYGNKKTVVDGITFDSRHEAQRYQELKLLQRAGHIRDLELQPVFELQPAFVSERKRVQAITYRGDFSYTEVKDGVRAVEDAKGYRTKDYILKMKLFLRKYPEIRFREV